MLIFKFLNKNKKDYIYYETKEHEFYNKNIKLIEKVKSFYPSFDDYGFNLICSNILIDSFMNVDIIQKNIEQFKGLDMTSSYELARSLLKDRPYVLEEDGYRVFFPQFSRSLNYILTNNPLTIRKYPYDSMQNKPTVFCVDLFDIYGYRIFNSNFTNLKLILEDKTSAAFYSESFETIYIINNQGRLDIAIPIFDKYLKNNKGTNIEERIKKVMIKFYSNSRTSFINALKDEKLISEKMCKQMIKHVSVRKTKKIRLERFG